MVVSLTIEEMKHSNSCSSCYFLGAKVIVSVVCFNVLLKGMESSHSCESSGELLSEPIRS